MSDNRKPREADSRELMQRPEAWRPPEVLPEPNQRPGWSHRWVRISMIGTSDPANISSKFREGYEPCKADDYPEMMMHATQEGRFKGNIEVGGLLLCRIPEEFIAQRDSYYDKQSRAQMESVDNTFMRNNDPRMPLFKERRSEVSLGRN
jgi:hypothetical protein